MRRQERGCKHQSCAANPSAYSTVVRRWLCSYSSQARLLFVSLFGPLVFVGSLVAGFSVRRVSSPPGEGAVLVLSVLRLFVVLVYFAVEEFFLLCFRLSLLGCCFWCVLDFDDFLMDSVFWPFLRRFRSCGVPARWRDWRHVVLDMCRM